LRQITGFIGDELGTHKITKSVEFCYGHRLLNYQGKCQHLHGHNGLVEVDVIGSRLDELGMVVDFGLVRDLIKGWIDANLDHRMLLCQDDPIVPILEDMGEPMFVMESNPTAEAISKLIYQEANKQGLNVSEVRLWESNSSHATYSET
jgi:6-pyruvoyltetrahydropterin/6-carboxytetrahydropterin synthase